MKDRINALKKDVEAFKARAASEVEDFRIQFLSKKGIIPQLFADFRNVDPGDRKEMGALLNDLKTLVTDKVNALKEELTDSNAGDTDTPDLSKPVGFEPLGARHPLSVVRNDIIRIFERIGFTVSEGPEIEDDWHNFSALNFPVEHPARDMQDTFFLASDPDILLRTHTSSVQVRVMENSTPPIRTISLGRVFRNEAISARAHCIFHQLEGLYIDENVGFADLRQALMYFAQEMFGPETKIRLRPSYFPFTEPSAELDISCNICGGKGCNICKYTGWVEILGCGMVDPNVLESANIDSEKYTGYAFGMGLERMALVKYQIYDIRLFFENDIRFLNQFEALH